MENEAISESKRLKQKLYPDTFSSGDTRKQLLARSRFLLFKSSSK